MFRFLGLLIVLSVLILGLGYYRGWFHADSNNTNGQPTVSVSIDKDKINQDKANAQQEVKNLAHK